MMLTFGTFSVVMIIWVLYAFKMGFGNPWFNSGAHPAKDGFLHGFVGTPSPLLSAKALTEDGVVPGGYGNALTMPFPQAALAYFQFVFAAITPILALGSVLGRVNFKAWLPFTALWITFVYTVNAFLIWGGGYFGLHGALDYSGGYVIHLSAGISGFVAAAVIGPRLQRDREIDAPNNMAMVAVGAGLLWLGWNGFNGGDPYAANQSAAAAIVNTNLATAVAFAVWVGLDYLTGRKPSLIGGVNGIITGLVAITPAAGFVNGWGAIAIGVIAVRGRVRRDELPQPVAALPKCRRHPGGGVHPWFRGSHRRLVSRRLRGPAHGAVRRDLLFGRPRPRQRHAPQVAVLRRGLGDRLVGCGDVHPAEARRRVRPVTDEHREHGDRRRRRARARGVPVRHPVARLSGRGSERRRSADACMSQA